MTVLVVAVLAGEGREAFVAAVGGLKMVSFYLQSEPFKNPLPIWCPKKGRIWGRFHAFWCQTKKSVPIAGNAQSLVE